MLKVLNIIFTLPCIFFIYKNQIQMIYNNSHVLLLPPTHILTDLFLSLLFVLFMHGK